MRFIDFIRDRARYYNCPVCGRNLQGCELRMLKQVEDRFTVQVTCAACQVQFVVLLAVQGEAMEPVADDEIEIEVELTAEDELALAALESRPVPAEAAGNREPIASDEVLDVHLLLKRFDGRLSDLFRQPSRDRH